jgi:hypothetical protein
MWNTSLWQNLEKKLFPNDLARRERRREERESAPKKTSLKINGAESKQHSHWKYSKLAGVPNYPDIF